MPASDAGPPTPIAPGREPYIAIIGDMVQSRKLGAADRRRVQKDLAHLLERFNQRFAASIQAPFGIALGDEFEGLMRTEDAHNFLPEMIWQCERAIPVPPVRIGIGYGAIDTDLEGPAGHLDGPAFHRARAAIDLAKKEKRLGGVFEGFGETHDAILNGVARLMRYQRASWSKQQRAVVHFLRESIDQQNVAAHVLDLSKQAVSAYALDAGWDAYKEGEEALRQAIREACERPAPWAEAQMGNNPEPASR